MSAIAQQRVEPGLEGPNPTPAFLSPEELLAGAEVEHDIDVPRALVEPRPASGPTDADRVDGGVAGRVRIRPLVLRDVQLIAKAAKGDEALTSVLMIQRAVVEPVLDAKAIGRMPSGLVQFLVDQINRVSGLASSEAEIREMARAPMVQAFFVLAKEFGWTPAEIRTLTVGQVLGYLEMLNQSRTGAV